MTNNKTPPTPEEVKAALAEMLRNAAKAQPAPPNAPRPAEPPKQGN